jgi:hypothetical protein
MSASDVIARLRELRAKATAGEWRLREGRNLDGIIVAGPVVNMPKGASQSQVALALTADFMDDASERTANAAAIVAAMNSLESLLECASQLADYVAAEDAAVAEWPLLSVHPLTGDEPAMKRLANARAALQALAEGGAS